MTTRMLIDARHREETRVAVVKGNRIEEFDFESESHKQLKGNIYLARVTRVEPSLQAAFIEYGGNRHGFLAFSEIHPDYYQIPREDREALLREERSLSAQADEAAEAQGDDADAGHDADDDADGARYGEDDGDQGDGNDEGGEQSAAPKPEEHGGADDAGAEALRRGRMALRRRYKIQEVIKRRQVMLVQVVKEERGNKGAALTTYISLAGRYCVLMPNTAHGGGISRKIASAADRKRLKTIIAELNLPSSMGAIVRTAGLERTKTEIKRDFDYLTRLWDEIREKTLASTAPALIHEDSDLVKRAIRDVYGRDIEEVLVDGPEGYAQARQYMKLLMPSHAKKVRLYQDPVPLFHRAGVEGQLAAMMNPVVQLKSGGYIVINQTEALVAVDVNSGRSTREYNIEETALKTNCEAAEEVARQLRLRDLAGLIVIDFIDMESNGNNRRVERVLKDALKADRARIQVGRISGFGLMEMSRQRLRTGMLEASTHTCPMCDGGGVVRDPASAALLGLRMLEDEAVKGRCTQFRLRADRAVAVYALNRKRAELAELEERYGIAVEVVPDDALIGGRMAVDCSGPPPMHAPQATGLAAAAVVVDDDDDLDVIEEEEAEDDAPVAREEREERSERERGDRDDRRGGRRRRRRGRREDGGEREARDDRDERTADAGDEPADEAVRDEAEPAEAGREVRSEGDDREPRRRRRRRRRGGRRDGEAGGESFADGRDEVAGDAADDARVDDVMVAAVETLTAAEVDTAMAPEAAAADPVVEAALAMDASPVVDQQAAAEAPAKPKRTRRKKPDVAAEAPVEEAPAVEAPAEAAPAEPAEAPAKPKRTRRKKADVAAESPMAETASEAAAQQADGGSTVTEAQPDVAQTAPVLETSGETPGVDAPAVDAASGDDGGAAPDGEASPPRRGWWQRTFG